MDQLATGKTKVQLSGIPHRAIVSTRGHHFVVDAPLSLGGVNEEINPIDLLLSALATCATFVCETAAIELNVALQSIVTKVEGDFDPRGVCGDPVNPRFQHFRVNLELGGITGDD